MVAARCVVKLRRCHRGVVAVPVERGPPERVVRGWLAGVAGKARFGQPDRAFFLRQTIKKAGVTRPENC